MGMILEGPVRAPGELKSGTDAHRTLLMYMLGVPRCAGQVDRAGGLSSAGGRMSSVVVRGLRGYADLESETPGLAAIGGQCSRDTQGHRKVQRAGRLPRGHPSFH